MLSACKKPGRTHRCHQCQYCRVLDRMDWVNRLKLEFFKRPYAYFITLTYDDEFLPVFHYSQKAELYKPDLIKFIDKIRNKLPKITIFAVGEYGGYLFDSPKAKRPIHPHYHIAVFCDDPSIDICIRAIASQCWFMGHTHILRLSGGLIDYITGYATKKLTNTKSMQKMVGLNIRPEFLYSSRRPAIGDISDELVRITEQYGELTELSVDGKKVIIPKYLRFKVKDYFLRWDLDFKNPADQQEYERRKYEKKLETLSTLRQKEDAQMEEISARSLPGDVYQKKAAIKKQMVINFESTLKRHTKGEKVL